MAARGVEVVLLRRFGAGYIMPLLMATRGSSVVTTILDLDDCSLKIHRLSYGPPWAHYLGGYQDRLLGGPLGLPGLRYTAPEGVEHKDNTGVVLG
jgi:hypothetical protein